MQPGTLVYSQAWFLATHDPTDPTVIQLLSWHKLIHLTLLTLLASICWLDLIRHSLKCMTSEFTPTMAGRFQHISPPVYGSFGTLASTSRQGRLTIQADGKGSSALGEKLWKTARVFQGAIHDASRKKGLYRRWQTYSPSFVILPEMMSKHKHWDSGAPNDKPVSSRMRVYPPENQHGYRKPSSWRPFSLGIHIVLPFYGEFSVENARDVSNSKDFKPQKTLKFEGNSTRAGGPGQFWPCLAELEGF